MLFQEYREQRLRELQAEQWGDARLPDLIAVYNLIRPKTVLEIGCFQGVSTEYWLLMCQRVVAVDPWPEQWVYSNFLLRASHYPHLVMVKGFSPLAVDLLGPEQFDMIYIDGDHSYEAVVADIEMAQRRVKPGGWIAGHDYTNTGDTPGVNKAVEQYFGVPKHTFSDGSWAVKQR